MKESQYLFLDVIRLNCFLKNGGSVGGKHCPPRSIILSSEKVLIFSAVAFTLFEPLKNKP